MGDRSFGNNLTDHIYPIILGNLEILILPILWLQLQQKVFAVLFILV